jgi:16S rRNA (guanine(966)-N(2))-methyltransferase RsmD
MGTRIIGGGFKGQRLKSLPKGAFTRPILARIKKSLFDILKTRVSDASFLDLFSGSGSVGIEAISRGARRVVFVDSSAQCRRWIEDALKEITQKHELFIRQAEWEVYRADVLAGLDFLGEQFNVIFCGVPYKDEKKQALFLVKDVLDVIERDKILAEGGWVVVQHHVKEKVQGSSSWDFFRQEQYGDTYLSFFKAIRYVQKT